jgi:hypothetical protein
MRDLLHDALFHCDIPVRAVSSDATSDGSVGDGLGVRISGYQGCIVLASLGNPTTSDGVGVVRLQYATNSTVASDNADSDYANFSTDIASASLTFATSDLTAGEGSAVLSVDFKQASVSDGCVRTQLISNGTGQTPQGCTWIVLYGKSGIRQTQPITVVSVP